MPENGFILNMRVLENDQESHRILNQGRDAI